MSELFEKRALFTSLLPKLIEKMIADGYTPLIGKDGLKHMKNSLHYEGLAVDIDLFKDGEYLFSGLEHKQFGEFWESLDPLCAWGGRFKDANHYSVAYGGRK
ncbi:MAG: hypothetical protein WC208_14920 [Gallionella sp.]